MRTKQGLTDGFDPEHALLRMAALDAAKERRREEYERSLFDGTVQEERFRLLEAWQEDPEEEQAERTLLMLQACACGLWLRFDRQWKLVPMTPEEQAENQSNFQRMLHLFLRQREQDRQRKRPRRHSSSQQVRSVKLPGRHHCLWLEQGQMHCRFLADPGDLYCKKHQKQWREEVAEAVKHPEKWQWREETINGKTYRDLVYQP